MVAHEIRNPLGVIRGAVELVRARSGASLPARDGEALDDVLGEVERLRRLTDDFLDLAREPAHRDRRRSTLADIAEDAARALAAPTRASTSGSRSRRSRVQADPARLRQVLANLLAERGRRRARGMRRCEPARVEGHGAALVDAGRRARRRCRRCANASSSPSRRAGADGTGLGLAIAAQDRGAARRRRCASSRGRRPCRARAFERAAARSRAGVGVATMARVLVVDDEPKLGKLVAEMLELDGHDGRPRRRRRARRSRGSRPARFDVVVTDLRMPEVDGLAVLARGARAPRAARGRAR